MIKNIDKLIMMKSDSQTVNEPNEYLMISTRRRAINNLAQANDAEQIFKKKNVNKNVNYSTFRSYCS